MKTILLSLALLSSQFTFAHEIPCGTQAKVVKIEDIEKILKELRWHGADDNQIKNAQCKTKNVPSEKDIDEVIKAASLNSAKGQVHGVQFENESTQLIEAFKNLTTMKDSFGWDVKAKSQKEIQKSFAVNPECKKVKCAVEKIWGKDMGPKLLYMYLKHGFNGSELAFEDSDRFKPDELNNALIALEDLPQSLIPLGKNQRLTHFSRGYTLKMYDGNTVANAVVMLFDLYDHQTPQQKQYTVYHEMSHNISTKLSGMDENSEWLAQSGWVKKGDDWSAKKGACFISEYGTTNPWEDFAESLSSYRYDPNGFKNSCPEKYKFIKNKVYKGIEYLTEDQCSPISTEKLGLMREEILKNTIDKIDVVISDEVMGKQCKNSFGYPASEAELKLCSEKIFAAQTLEFDANAITQILKKHGIKDTTYNRDLVLKGVEDKIKSSNELKEKAHLKQTEIDSHLKNIVEAQKVASMPKDLPTWIKDHNSSEWYFIFQDNCKKLLWTNDDSVVEKCIAESLVKRDQEKQSWSSGYFPKFTPSELLNTEGKNKISENRREDIKKWLIETDQSLPFIKDKKAKFASDLKNHMSQISFDLEYHAKRRDYKKLPPEEYCKTYYSKGSVYTSMWGMDKTAEIKLVEDFCLENQKDTRRRKIIKEEDYTNWINQTISP